MPSSSITKPCPNCAKPIRKDAAKCWFCGDVFNTVRCGECGSPVKIGSPACQFCGEQAPETPEPLTPTAPAAAGSAPPRATRADDLTCPACDRSVPLAAVQCKHCGEPLTGPSRKKNRPNWGEGKSYAPHRGGRLVALAVASLFCFPVVLAPLVVVLAVGDLKAMRAERMDPDGLGQTIAALVIGGIVTLLVYTLIGVALLNQWV